MAERFPEIELEEIQEVKENAENENTRKKRKKKEEEAQNHVLERKTCSLLSKDAGRGQMQQKLSPRVTEEYFLSLIL